MPRTILRKFFSARGSL